MVSFNDGTGGASFFLLYFVLSSLLLQIINRMNSKISCRGSSGSGGVTSFYRDHRSNFCNFVESSKSRIFIYDHVSWYSAAILCWHVINFTSQIRLILSSHPQYPVKSAALYHILEIWLILTWLWWGDTWHLIIMLGFFRLGVYFGAWKSTRILKNSISLSSGHSFCCKNVRKNLLFFKHKNKLVICEKEINNDFSNLATAWTY